jgi:hypothetical protein
MTFFSIFTNWASFLDSSGPKEPAVVLLKEFAIPPGPKNLGDLVEDGGTGIGFCKSEAVGALLFLKEYVLCIVSCGVV